MDNNIFFLCLYLTTAALPSIPVGGQPLFKKKEEVCKEKP